MAKQIYIDSNGNEVMLSGTINRADILPYDDSKSTADAIGVLDDLNTSVKSSCVDAVNEVNSITDLTDSITFHSGVTRYLGGVYKQGKFVICNMTLKIEQNINNNESLINGLPMMPTRSIKFPCLVGTDQYLIGDSDGALYMAVNSTSIIRWGNLTATTSNPKYMTMMFVYATT